LLLYLGAVDAQPDARGRLPPPDAAGKKVEVFSEVVNFFVAGAALAAITT